jgi:hypothetical protein
MSHLPKFYDVIHHEIASNSYGEISLKCLCMFYIPKNNLILFFRHSSDYFIRLIPIWQDFRRCNTTSTGIEGTEHIVLSSS